MRVKVRVGVERAWAALSSASMKPSTCACTLLFALALSSSCCSVRGGGVRARATPTPTTPPLPRAPYPYRLHPNPYFPNLLLVDAHVLERAPVRLHVALEARARAVGAVARVEEVVEAQAFARVRVTVRVRVS